jgi:hypothetical protein
MKLEDLLHDIKYGVIFGPCNAGTLQNYICNSIFILFTISYLKTIIFHSTVLHIIEFQKCGLPHAHIIFWVSMDTLQPTAALIAML